MRTIIFLFVSTLVLNAPAQDLKSGGPLKPEQAIMDIRHYTIALNVDPVQQSIDGYTEISLNLSKPAGTLLFDFWHG
ncbi:MAG TPA: hypothetical protein PKL81_17235, partial [Ferruginibacter sp.]|nr:hypothetical protein [Ferruginibacter sp.]